MTKNYKCQYCYNEEVEDLTFNKDKTGYWCEVCDGFTLINQMDKGRYLLILEESSGKNEPIPSSIKFKKRLSPLRYPGGKSKMVNYIYNQLDNKKMNHFVSPYTGGGSVEFALLEAGVINHLHINDKDFGVYALYWVIFNMPFALTERLKTYTPSHEDFYKAQLTIKKDFDKINIVEAAWNTLIVNRLAYSGIFNANPLGGKKGTPQQLTSRWNPDELIRRIEKLHSFSDQVTISNQDACEMIEESYWWDQTTIFIDPPYVNKASSLYRCYYKEEDHIKLNCLLDNLYHGFDGADLIITYDNNEWLESLYLYPTVKAVSRAYTV
ncbi:MULTISPECIES: DNA adenine methylase [Bacillaceae]|uniref:DNA adenine methylase n=1 Tax=Bacillaceae TaxID=186817 RepID=UPI002040B722|nr:MULTISPECIES: DNA adenine methylase [Bacillaceae]MCM3362539.1 DNA adenine methylase [Niallia sp. MER TA 168]CAI9386647.1 hypothetical protein BACSP_01710 [Bacillus sp. T2.9-1]